ncbi:hypothetical protein ACLKA6_013518 [Drosophila palustris]
MFNLPLASSITTCKQYRHLQAVQVVVRAAGPVATQKPVATPVRAAQKIATVAGQQEAQDERPSTSAAAAARMSTSSAHTEPRASYASAKKVKVAVLPVDCPQVSLRRPSWMKSY